MPTAKVNGTELYYEVRGEGEPILFLHGMGGTWRMWEPQMDFFSNHFKLIMVDLRGHGQSGKGFPNGKFSYEVMADDLKYLLDELHIKQVHVVGVSMGGTVGQIFAYTYPQYVNRLVLSDSFCEVPQTAKWVLSLTILLARMLPKSFINAATYSMHKGKDADEVYTREMLKKSTSFTKKQFIEMKRSTFPNGMKAALRNISAPSLVVFGDKKLYGIDEEKAAITIFENIAESILAGFKGAFDPVTIMRKDKFNEVVFRFLNNTELPDIDGVYYSYKETALEQKLNVI